MNYSPETFLDFLVAAKVNTYASQGDNASVSPLLKGSRQLEFRRGKFFYRDIYFGMCYFVGQETVYFDEQPIWAMNYAGGVPKSFSVQEAKEIYAFLQKALRQVSHICPYRGPENYQEGSYVYTDSHQGDIGMFCGRETIVRNGVEVYNLNYSGGFIR